MVWLTSFSVKEGVKLEKRGFQPMGKKLSGKFGVVFSFAVVVMDTELDIVGQEHRKRTQRYDWVPDGNWSGDTDMGLGPKNGG